MPERLKHKIILEHFPRIWMYFKANWGSCLVYWLQYLDCKHPSLLHSTAVTPREGPLHSSVYLFNIKMEAVRSLQCEAKHTEKGKPCPSAIAMNIRQPVPWTSTSAVSHWSCIVVIGESWKPHTFAAGCSFCFRVKPPCLGTEKKEGVLWGSRSTEQLRDEVGHLLGH